MENTMTEADPPNADPARGAPPPAGRGLPVAPKRLYRDPTGPVAGVASGMAGYFNVDPVLVRLLWLVALFSGIGFFAYVVCWVIVPKAPTWPPPGYGGDALSGGKRDDMGPVVSGALIIAAAAVLGAHFGGLGDMILPAVLVGFGVYLLNQRAAAPMTSRTTAATDIPEAMPGDAVSRGGEAAELVRAERAAPAEHSGIITPAVLSLLALMGGVAWALHSADVIRWSIATASAVGLIVVGAGLVASIWLGRARGLVPMGLGLGAILLVSSAAEPWLDETERFTSQGDSGSKQAMGAQHHRPTSLAELEAEYRLGLGELVVDLREVDLEGVTRNVQVEVGIGQATVLVPSDVSLEVTGEVGIGNAKALGVASEGLGRKVEASASGDGAGKLVIHFEIGIGEGTVRREL